jgi:hypothetical protein
MHASGLKNELKMETTFFGLAMPKVLQHVRNILMRKGFLVQLMPTSEPVLIAYQSGNWLRKGRHLILEMRSLENNLTRIDITAIVNKKNSRHDEEILELDFASVLRNAFKKTKPNGN